MERTLMALCCGLCLAACDEPIPRLPDPPEDLGVTVARHALEQVAGSAALDPDALWAEAQAQNPDLVRVLERAAAMGIEAVSEETFPCPGGGTLTVRRDEQGPPWPSTGDRYETIFEACVQGRTTLDGSRRFLVEEISGQPYVSAPWRSVSRVQRQGFTVSGPWGSQTVDGEGRIVLESADNVVTTQRSSGDWRTTRDQNGQTSDSRNQYRIEQRWNSADASQRLTFDVTLSGGLWGDTRVRTLSPLTGPWYGPPESGEVEIVQTDATGSVRTTWIQAQPAGQARVSTDLDGDGVADVHTQTTWFALGVERYLNVYY